MKSPILLSVLSAVTLLIGCQNNSTTLETAASSSGNQLQGTISLSGSFALYPLVNVWAEEFRKEHPDVRFNISAGGAGKGVADVLNGAVDLALCSRSIAPAEEAQGAWPLAICKDAVLATISSHNPNLPQLKREGLSQDKLSTYFRQPGPHNWPNKQAIMVYTRADAAGSAVTWAEYLGARGQEQLKGIAVFGDPGLVEAIRRDPTALGYNNLVYVYDLSSGQKYEGVEVIPLDLNGNGRIDPEEDFYDSLDELNKAIADGRYPSPPARELYLVAHNQPKDPLLREFLSWVLTQGQAYVEANGYVLLSPELVQTQLNKLNAKPGL